MARGRGGGKQRGGGRTKFSNNKPSRGKFNQKSFNKRDASHWKEFGEAHPSEDTESTFVSSDKRRKYEEPVRDGPSKTDPDSSDDESVEEASRDHFKQLLSTFSGFDNKTLKKSIESDEDEDDSSSSENDELHPEEENKEHIDESFECDSDDSHVSESEINTGTENQSCIKSSVNEEGLPVNESNSEPEIESDEDESGEQEELDQFLDPFVRHFHYDMSDNMYDTVSTVPIKIETHQQNWPVLGQLIVHLPKPADTVPNKLLQKPVSKMSIAEEKKYAEPGSIPTKINEINWSQLYIKPQIHNNIMKANESNLTREEISNSISLTPLQKELFSVINNYQDIYYPSRTLTNGEEIRFIYCLHAVNHALKTRIKIIHHNARLAKKVDVPDEFRDQGLVRPKVVILVPFRESALRVIKMIIAILFKDEKANVMNMKRFVDEHTGDVIAMPKKNPRPEDYEATFTGNTDDSFRIGMTVTKKSLKLYADFYSADIIVASPLGLRVIVGAEGESERDFDFLASIELLVLDQTEIFLMQNWDHLLHVLDHFHLQPKDSHGTDFGRVRSWALNGWARYYRQTLVFASLMLPEINAICSKKCHNYKGRVRVVNPVVTGSICQVVVQLPQVFHRFDVKSAVEAIDARFELFIKKILPQYKDSNMNHVMIYVPSYFDYVQLRNYMKREDLSFVQICEYTKEGKIARARDMFFHGDAHFLLYSERFHFFRRLRIKGIRHIIFYQPPIFPNLYAEMCNLMHAGNHNKWTGSDSNMTITVLHSKYDVQQVTAMVGTDRARRMVSSGRNVHMFMTGE